MEQRQQGGAQTAAAGGQAGVPMTTNARVVPGGPSGVQDLQQLQLRPAVVEVEESVVPQEPIVHEKKSIPQCLKSSLLDVIFFVIFVAGLNAADRFLLVTPRRGFMCSDPSIYMPFHRDSIPRFYVVAIAAGIISITIVVAELVRIVAQNYNEHHSVRFREGDCGNWLSCSFTYISCCALGLLLGVSLCLAAKCAVGRLRPSFIISCRPNDVSLSECYANRTVVTKYSCSGKADRAEDAHKSFFSLTATIAMHFAVFFVVYIQGRVSRRICGYALRPALQFAIIISALIVGYSRITDYQNFGTDVFVGFLVGVGTALLSAVSFAELLTEKEEPGNGEDYDFLSQYESEDELTSGVSPAVTPSGYGAPSGALPKGPSARSSSTHEGGNAEMESTDQTILLTDHGTIPSEESKKTT